MNLKTLGVIALLLSAQTATAANVEFVGDAERLQPLATELQRLASMAEGTVGVAAIHLESGRGLYLHGDERFPMASTYKVPIAVEMMRQIDDGRRSLDDLVTVRPEDKVETHSVIRDFFFHGGSKLTLRDLTELMLRVSDNVATDLLFTEAGGGEVITQRMRAIGAEGIRVDRTTRELIGNWLGRATSEDEPLIPSEEFDQLVDPAGLEALTNERLAQLNEKFNSDPRDTATPKAMATLLRGIWERTILSESSSAFLIDVMERCQTGELRLKGALPTGTVVAHKTGTIGQTTNDVGVITLPNDAGHVISVVFIKESRLPDNAAMEPVIAQLARTIHDYFVLHPAGNQP